MIINHCVCILFFYVIIRKIINIVYKFVYGKYYLEFKSNTWQTMGALFVICRFESSAVNVLIILISDSGNLF